MISGRTKSALAACVLLLNVAATDPADPDNPTCPKYMNWSTYPQMKFTLETVDGVRVLKAEGQIDQDVPAKLQDALKANDPVQEIWLRSPGGDARAGNAAGKMIRAAMIPTRIPNGWVCFSACNFMFMGGAARFVDPGGIFAVHMFTHLGDKEAVRSELKNTDKAIGMIGDVEQDSALLASEDNDFLIRMGVSRKLLTDVMYKQKAVADGDGDKSTRRCLTRDEDLKYNVANAQYGARAMGLKPLVWTAAVAIGLASTAALANVVVVRSLGPSAKAYPPGKTLPASAKITLQGGDVVTILGPGTAQTLRGPGSFDTTQVSMDAAAGQRGRFGALRTAEVSHSPSVWDIDVTQSGKVCVADAKKLQLWRPDSDSDESIEIKSSDGSTQKLSWAHGKALTAWPAALPVKTGAQYEIASSARPDKSSLEVVTLAAVPTDKVATAQELIKNGCQNQLDLLVANATKDSSGQ